MYNIIKEELEKLVIPGMPIIDIVETIEEEIKNAGYIPAFPVNISINEISAHYTPGPDDNLTIKDDDLIKIDFGYHNGDGLAIDNAITIDLSGKHDMLIEAAEKSVYNAISIIKHNITVDEISEVIHKTLMDYGIKPISNLTGHIIEPYWLHGRIAIPPIPDNIKYPLKKGSRIAIEVFTTYPEAAGIVSETQQPHIFSLVSLERGVRTRIARKLLLHIVKHYKTLPFSDRWLVNVVGSKFMVKSALKELEKLQLIEKYPPLKEIRNYPVAQFELTVEVTEDGAKILSS